MIETTLSYIKEIILGVLALVIIYLVVKRKKKSVAQPEIRDVRKLLREANQKIVVDTNEVLRIVDKFLERLENGIEESS